MSQKPNLSKKQWIREKCIQIWKDKHWSLLSWVRWDEEVVSLPILLDLTLQHLPVNFPGQQLPFFVWGLLLQVGAPSVPSAEEWIALDDDCWEFVYLPYVGALSRVLQWFSRSPCRNKLITHRVNLLSYFPISLPVFPGITSRINHFIWILVLEPAVRGTQTGCIWLKGHRQLSSFFR